MILVALALIASVVTARATDTQDRTIVGGLAVLLWLCAIVAILN